MANYLFLVAFALVHFSCGNDVSVKGTTTNTVKKTDEVKSGENNKADVAEKENVDEVLNGATGQQKEHNLKDSESFVPDQDKVTDVKTTTETVVPSPTDGDANRPTKEVSASGDQVSGSQPSRNSNGGVTSNGQASGSATGGHAQPGRTNPTKAGNLSDTASEASSGNLPGKKPAGNVQTPSRTNPTRIDHLNDTATESSTNNSPIRHTDGAKPAPKKHYPTKSQNLGDTASENSGRSYQGSGSLGPIVLPGRVSSGQRVNANAKKGLEDTAQERRMVAPPRKPTPNRSGTLKNGNLKFKKD